VHHNVSSTLESRANKTTQIRSSFIRLQVGATNIRARSHKRRATGKSRYANEKTGGDKSEEREREEKAEEGETCWESTCDVEGARDKNARLP
jgi:hypothetical protein